MARLRCYKCGNTYDMVCGSCYDADKEEWKREIEELERRIETLEHDKHSHLSPT